ncbi:GntR family transcriptional regulator [Variovorax sp. J2P1-59]|uniref:GntR family transcriptional regulator n=2 Tax=Variovorax TaxID=34072 RepID=UPI002574C005|nr:GntR family transcriptional regulator [Variovorax sp. J2P1-59]MDM0078781.1 GntR family transcriptional regulator [Variovorax sp. J2P1-59]
MATSKRPRAKPRIAASEELTSHEPQRRRMPVSLSDAAYERIEELLVCCELKPGRFLATHDLQKLTGFGRTPVLQAVNRLAADTLLIVAPRHGVQIAPVDLTRDRVLLRLRRDMERFVIRLATERSGASQRNQMLHLKRHLIERRGELNLDQFNLVDRRIDKLFMAAAGEPFVESTLRPLHTIFRRLGWIYHTQTGRGVNLNDTVDGHVAVIEAVADGQVDKAIAASDHLMDFVEGMFDVLEREVSPTLLDCSLDMLDDTFMEGAALARIEA